MDIYLKIVFKKILLMKRIVLKEKWKAKWNRILNICLNLLHLFDETNATSRKQYYLNTTVYKFNKFNIGKVNGIQKKFVKLHKIGEQIKSSLLLTLLE